MNRNKSRFMRSLILVALFCVLLATNVYATGACVYTSTDTDTAGREIRRMITFTCTSDAGGIAAYSFNPKTYGVKGWFLYNITTDPDGTSAPTNLYDITLLATGEDIAGGLLIDRSATLRQTVTIAPTTLGYHMIDGIIVFTFANITSNPGIFTLRLRCTTN
jgi:hypothetical protein